MQRERQEDFADQRKNEKRDGQRKRKRVGDFVGEGETKRGRETVRQVIFSLTGQLSDSPLGLADKTGKEGV